MRVRTEHAQHTRRRWWGLRPSFVARARGVAVRVLVDGWGSINLANAFWDPLIAAGGQFVWFNPVSLHRWAYRNHRKLLVCDDRVAYVGGFNIADEYSGDGVTQGWRDLGVEITGAPVHDLAASFDQLFARASFRHKRWQRLRPAQNHMTSGQNWKLLLSGPGLYHATLKRTIARDLKVANEVKIMCAYFLPTWRLRKEIIRAGKRGGSVQLILAGKSDVGLMQLACRRLYRQFMRAGVEIYEYQPQVLHAKLFIIKDAVYVGSANLDTRSLRINYELLMRIEDHRVASEARALFKADLRHCRRIEPRTWDKSRNIWTKLKEKWAYFLLARVDPYIARRQLRSLK